MIQNKSDILLGFYGDDFTGSTDALEFITRAGARTVLFTEPPSAEQLAVFPGLQAYGIAGKTRSLTPDAMEKALVPAFEQMKTNGARHIHYKVCSTFDSSPSTGSIGKAIDCGAAVFQNKKIIVLGGSPSLGRYCVYGNLFARMGIGSEGKIYRLDRHPSMRKHPVTPADESDLRLHLGKQTQKKFGLIDIQQSDKPVKEWMSAVQEEEEIILVDCLNESQLSKIGEWLDTVSEESVQFSVGGSGIEAALGQYWNREEILQVQSTWPAIEKINPLLVISGSCSPVTAAQVAFAKANGFEQIELNARIICEEDIVPGEQQLRIKELLTAGKSVIVHTGEKQEISLSSEKVGTALGTIARRAVERCRLKRVIIAGGDTSSYAARAMEIEAVEMIAPLVSGAPLCKAYSTNKAIDGLEVNFKGGQVGGEDYFTLF